MKQKHTLILQRHYGEQGTNGILKFQGRQICYTIELPWRNNQVGESCIPAGRYKLEKKHFPKHGEQIGIPEVRGREAILIHAANDALKELKGCIAPVSNLIDEGKGQGSRAALAELKALVYCFWDMDEEVFLLIP